MLKTIFSDWLSHFFLLSSLLLSIFFSFAFIGKENNYFCFYIKENLNNLEKKYGGACILWNDNFIYAHGQCHVHNCCENKTVYSHSVVWISRFFISIQIQFDLFSLHSNDCISAVSWLISIFNDCYISMHWIGCDDKWAGSSQRCQLQKYILLI